MKRRTRELTLRQQIEGKWHRFWMKLSHRFGFCYPEPMLVDPELVWCHWCGMRGKRLVVDFEKVRAEMEAKMRASRHHNGGESDG